MPYTMNGRRHCMCQIRSQPTNWIPTQNRFERVFFGFNFLVNSLTIRFASDCRHSFDALYRNMSTFALTAARNRITRGLRRRSSVDFNVFVVLLPILFKNWSQKSIWISFFTHSVATSVYLLSLSAHRSWLKSWIILGHSTQLSRPIFQIKWKSSRHEAD